MLKTELVKNRSVQPGRFSISPSYTKDELGNLAFARAANTFMDGFHRLKQLQVLCKRKGFRGGGKSRRQLQLSSSNQKLVRRFTDLDKVFPPRLLTDSLAINQTPLVDLLLLSITLFLFFAATVCVGAFGDLVVAAPDVQESCNERQYIVKHFAKLKNKSKWLLLLLPVRGRSTTTLGLLLLFLSSLIVPSSAEGTNLRQNITYGNVTCFHYNQETRLFWMTCDTLEWKWDANTYISLGANEIFDGGRAGNPEGKGVIDLTGIENFDGLFRVDENDVESFAEAPLIRNVHVKNGTTASYGGFIVQERQEYFIVDSCSSTGVIEGIWGGGICGYQCGYQGEIKISNSYSTGRTKGRYAGGIAGNSVGYKGIAHITQCHSTGDIKGIAAGGICGYKAGRYGKLKITQSYSTGDILVAASGGITGDGAGQEYGCVFIQECYSKGKISGDYSGGICGDDTSENNGEVHIIDCYSRGDIEGSKAGGITGRWTGLDNGAVYIENTYASGNIDHNAGGLIGHIPSDSGIVDVKYSVYNHGPPKIVGDGESYLTTNTGNSYELNDIIGKLYSFNGTQRWSNETWALNGTDSLPILRFQLLESREQQRPTPSPGATRTPSPTESPSPSATPTPTASSTTTGTSSHTATPSSTTTGTDTPSPTRSPSQTPTPSPTTTGTPSPTSSVSPTVSRTPTSSATSTQSPTRSASPSATKTPSPSTSPRGLTTKKVLPVKRPARHVDMRGPNGRRDRQRRKNK